MAIPDWVPCENCHEPYQQHLNGRCLQYASKFGPGESTVQAALYYAHRKKLSLPGPFPIDPGRNAYLVLRFYECVAEVRRDTFDERERTKGKAR